MPVHRFIAIVAIAATPGIVLSPTLANAQGFGSFALCYERLKQLVTLLGAQGQAVEETIDEPGDKRYVVVTTFGSRERTMSCSPKGDLVVVDD